MRFLADENVSRASLVVLREAGHDVVGVADIQLGMPDTTVLAYAYDQDRILFTFDRDFGALTFLGEAPIPPAIVLLRFPPAAPDEAGRVLLDLASRPDLQLLGRFTVVDREQIRQRAMPPSHDQR